MHLHLQRTWSQRKVEKKQHYRSEKKFASIYLSHEGEPWWTCPDIYILHLMTSTVMHMLMFSLDFRMSSVEGQAVVHDEDSYSFKRCFSFLSESYHVSTCASQRRWRQVLTPWPAPEWTGVNTSLLWERGTDVNIHPVINIRQVLNKLTKLGLKDVFDVNTKPVSLEDRCVHMCSTPNDTWHARDQQLNIWVHFFFFFWPPLGP